MKKLFFVMMAFAAMLAMGTPTAIAQAQDDGFVHYDVNKKASKGRPDFHKVDAAIDIDIDDPAIRNVVQKRFEDLGAGFIGTKIDHCVTDRPIICVRYSLGPQSNVSGSGYSSAYGNRGGFSTGGSFSGQQCVVVLSIFLVQYNPADGGRRPTIPLAEASSFAFAGSGSSYSSGYGGNGGGSYFASQSGGWNIGPPLSADIDALLSTNSFGGLLRKGLSLGTQNMWFRGSADLLEKTFPTKISAQ